MTRQTHDATAQPWARLPASFHTEVSRRYVVLQEPLNEASEEVMSVRLGRLGYDV